MPRSSSAFKTAIASCTVVGYCTPVKYSSPYTSNSSKMTVATTSAICSSSSASLLSQETARLGKLYPTEPINVLMAKTAGFPCSFSFISSKTDWTNLCRSPSLSSNCWDSGPKTSWTASLATHDAISSSSECRSWQSLRTSCFVRRPTTIRLPSRVVNSSNSVSIEKSSSSSDPKLLLLIFLVDYGVSLKVSSVHILQNVEKNETVGDCVDQNTVVSLVGNPETNQQLQCKWKKWPIPRARRKSFT